MELIRWPLKTQKDYVSWEISNTFYKYCAF